LESLILATIVRLTRPSSGSTFYYLPRSLHEPKFFVITPCIVCTPENADTKDVMVLHSRFYTHARDYQLYKLCKTHGPSPLSTEETGCYLDHNVKVMCLRRVSQSCLCTLPPG
jgi:hypothetical protein